MPWRIAAKNHANGAVNPLAHFQKTWDMRSAVNRQIRTR